MRTEHRFQAQVVPRAKGSAPYGQSRPLTLRHPLRQRLSSLPSRARPQPSLLCDPLGGGLTHPRPAQAAPDAPAASARPPVRPVQQRRRPPEHRLAGQLGELSIGRDPPHAHLGVAHQHHAAAGGEHRDDRSQYLLHVPRPAPRRAALRACPATASAASPARRRAAPDRSSPVLAAEMIGEGNHVLTVLLRGEAGLRCGEMMVLPWSGHRPAARHAHRGTSGLARARGTPKGGHARVIPLATRLRKALVEHRNVEGPNCHGTCYRRPPSAKTVSEWLHKVQRVASLRETRTTHAAAHVLLSPCDQRGRNPGAPGASRVTGASRPRGSTWASPPGAGRSAIETLRRPPHWRQAL